MVMSRVEEIERAIEGLNPEEFLELARWVMLVQNERWDQQLDHDASEGRLDFLRDEARDEDNKQFLKNWP